MKDKLTLVTDVGEPTLFDSFARLVPKDLQAAMLSRSCPHTATESG